MRKQDLEYGDLIFRVARVCKGSGVDCKVVCKDCKDYKYEIISERLTKDIENQGLDNIYLTPEEAKKELMESGVEEIDIILNFD